MTAEQLSKPKEEKPEDTEETLALLEAALYVAGRPLELKTLGSVIAVRSKKRVQALSRQLAQRYLDRKGALELIELDDGRFVLQLKPEYSPHVRRLSIRPLLSQSPLRTLAYIAYRQPVTQAHVAAVRGSEVYVHIKELRGLGLIVAEKLGKTKVLRTTEIFADYFNLDHNPRLMKHQLKALFDTGETLGKQSLKE
jgi:segregation and condensation protein B